ncbi:MAG: J domain-containing protein [Treponema sp.]|jgi:curved DNA-binding protein CbpA|nr:J domain-containing protein [Treponema sp.]
MRGYAEYFKEKINRFIAISQNAGDNNAIKSEYIKLVKEFHPDVNKRIENELANEYMVIINYIYEQIMRKKKIMLRSTDEYEKNKAQGKYCFINEEGIREYISDKIVYMYKLGKHEYDRALLICMGSSGNTEKEGYEIIGHLYKSYKHFKEVIKMDGEGIWGNAARKSLDRAYAMNRRITRGLRGSPETPVGFPELP